MEPVTRLLASKIIPWLRQDGEHRLIVARPSMRQSMLPDDVTLSSRPIKGKRVIRKDRRLHANQRLHIADWPEANLHELTVPKLACVLDGPVDYSLGKYCVHCGEGNYILIPPRMPHHRYGAFWETPGQDCPPYRIFHAYAYSHGIYCWLTNSKNGQPFNDQSHHYLILNSEAVTILNLLMEEAVSGKEGFETACAGLLTAFFVLIKREIQAGNYTHPGPKTSHENSSPSSTSFAGQVREYLELNCHKPLKLAGVAAHFYMSPSKFMRYMRRETGGTFNELLVAIRIERAKTLLRETDWTFTIISSHLSFRSSSYFLALFRQKVGCTPSEYRHREK